MRTKFVRLLAFCLVIISSSQALADIRFGVAAEPYPPFTTKDASGKWTGWEIDLLDAVCRALNEKCRIVEVSWDGIIPALQANQLDVIWSSMAITAERKKVIDFTDKYYNMPASIAGAKSEKFGILPANLKDKSIGVQISTIHQNYVEKYYIPKGARIKTYQTQDEAVQDLAAGRVDAVMADSLALSAFLQSDQGQKCCDLKGEVPDDPVILGAGVGAGVRKSDIELKNKLNIAIRQVRDSGEYAKITSKYFAFDVYGN